MDEDYQTSILAHKLTEYNKLTKITLIQVLCFVEDENTFNNLTFMKNRLWNHLTTHHDVCVLHFQTSFFEPIYFSIPRCHFTLERGEDEVLGKLVELL
jgi:hypothetical protein